MNVRSKPGLHLVVGPAKSGRTSLLPPTDTRLHHDYTAKDKLWGNFLQQIREITKQAHYIRSNGYIPPNITITMDNIPREHIPPFFHARWNNFTVWKVYTHFECIESLLFHANEIYFSREKDLRRAVGDSHDIPQKDHSFQWWVLTHIRRRKLIHLYEPPVFGVLRRRIRRHLWTRWMREWVVMGRFKKRLVPRARLLLHRAYTPPHGRHFLDAQKRWNVRMS